MEGKKGKSGDAGLSRVTFSTWTSTAPLFPWSRHTVLFRKLNLMNVKELNWFDCLWRPEGNFALDEHDGFDGYGRELGARAGMGVVYQELGGAVGVFEWKERLVYGFQFPVLMMWVNRKRTEGVCAPFRQNPTRQDDSFTCIAR